LKNFFFFTEKNKNEKLDTGEQEKEGPG